MKRKEIFDRVRMQAMLVRRIGGQIREMPQDGIRSLRLDGMPRGTGGMYRGLDAQIEKKEAMERMLRRESALLLDYEKAARAQMDGMKPDEYAFCALYYIGALSLEETAEAIGRSTRQCARYKREIDAS